MRRVSLVKSRPRIGLRVPREVRPGEPFLAVVVLECRRPVELEHVDVLFVGNEKWWAGDESEAQDLVRIGARLCDARALPVGRTELPVRIPLPVDAPPSFAGTIEYELSVHAAIDWWPDARATFEVKVVPPPMPSPPTEPRLFSSDPGGPRAKERHIEVSLASAWVRAGGMVSGAFALANVAHHRYSSVTIALRAVQSRYGAGAYRPSREHVRYSIRVDVSQAREGEMIPFRFTVPVDVPPEYRQLPRPRAGLGLSALMWELEVVVQSHWSSDLTLRIPFGVLPRSDRAGDAPLRFAPVAVGTDRVRALWEAVGRQHGLTYDEQSLRGRMGETELVVRRDHMGRDGVFLVGELTYPELFLELSVEPASAVSRLVGGDVRIGEAEWDRDHTVSARDAHQSAAFMRALLPALKGARLRRLHDRALAVELRDAGQSQAQLQAFVGGAVRLARRFEELRRDLPPRTGMEAAVIGWRELAQKLGAVLETARMRIAGTIGESAIEVRLALDGDGRPDGTWLSVHPTSPIDDAHCFRWHVSAGPASDAIALRFSGEIGQLAAILAHEARELRIEPERVAVCVPSVLGLTLPVEAAERRIERSVQLAALLRGQVGPYR